MAAKDRADTLQRETAVLTKDHDALAAKAAELEGVREANRRMENDLAAVREAIGSERLKEIVGCKQ